MLIRSKEYARKYGKNYSTIKRYLREGKLKTAKKVGALWLIDSDEPCPTEPKVKSGEYVGWREKYPTKRPGIKANRKPPRPTKRLYAVIQEVYSRVKAVGVDVLESENVLYVSYDYDEARALYEVEKDFTVIYNATPNHRGDPMSSRKMRIDGYRIHTDRGADPIEAWQTALANGDLCAKNLIYILSENDEWERPKHGVDGK